MITRLIISPPPGPDFIDVFWAGDNIQVVNAAQFGATDGFSRAYRADAVSLDLWRASGGNFASDVLEANSVQLKSRPVPASISSTRWMSGRSTGSATPTFQETASVE